MASGPVAVIDIGSNSIKLLVAERAPEGPLRTLTAKTIEARISAGISHATPELTEESMQRGLLAIRELLAAAAPHAPKRTILVATSAVRDAANGQVFRDRVRAATGQPVRILSGGEEANLIGRGLTCDPALAALRDFYVFDLGGGSLECLAFRERRIEQAASLPLGCVRVTEQLVPDSSKPLPTNSADLIRQLVEANLRDRFRFNLPAPVTAVGTGGTVTTCRAIFAARAGVALESSDPCLAVGHMRELAFELAALPLGDRQRVPGLPFARADVFPVALFTLGALADAGRLASYHHSFYNLRFGLADEALAAS
ncbi:Ppx/GppA phosphatase family protein [Opitutus terrae]|uniref:Ppx/GppA phosphatase n=1 Tax=Opitutus terrae (strain DSM 11246 / JCM 15787 / PB90-1) TaxID=452637 RepID=B1ZYX2_OPITP|nr:Ppx/GppA phosphatase [Opitutus terrae]ACB76295.1 Ppx/GppA phosphatase [Opitutus terrae PB90-1]